MFWRNNYTYIHTPNRKTFHNFILYNQFLILYYLPFFRASGHIFSNYYYPSQLFHSGQHDNTSQHAMLCGTQTYAIWWHGGLTVGEHSFLTLCWMGQFKEPMVRSPFGDDSFQASLTFPHTSVSWEHTS